MNKCPCKTCEFKGCGEYHDICEPYKEWQVKNEEYNAKRHEEYDYKFTNHPNKMTAFKKSMRRRK